MRKWDDLSMREKAEMMRVAVSNGITTLPEIKQAYNEFADGGAMPEAQPAENDGWSMEGNLFGGGGYKPSERIKQRIAHYEGKAMTGATDPLSGKWAKNNSFESEAKNFYNALPRDIREQVLSNPELADSLYSYSYNVGAGRFKERVVPALRNYYNGKGTVQDIENSMWASGDSKLRGLQRRRAEERKGVRNALIGDVPYLPSDTPSYPTIYDMPQYIPAQPQAFSAPLTSYQPVVLEEDVRGPLVEAAMDNAYTQAELDRQERRDRLDRFNMLMSLASPQQDNGMLGAISMLSGLGTANAYGEGGDIYIKPENRGKFTALKERTGHSATWFKEHGTPAQKKMAVFALNSRHWKHANGGNLFSGEETTTQQMNRPNIFRYDDGRYVYQAAPDAEEVEVSPINTLLPNPSQWTYQDASGKVYIPHAAQVDTGSIIQDEERNPLVRAANNYFREAAYRAKDGTLALQGKYTMPAIAASALLPMAGEAAYPILTNPYVDAGITSAFAGHGLNHAINEGIDGWGDAAMTALEVAPLGRLAKPMFKEAALIVENYRYPFGRPQVPEGYVTVKPQVRTRVGDVEIDNPNLLYHLDRGDSAGAFSNQGAYVEDGKLLPGIAKEGEIPYSWWNLGRPYATGVNGQPMTRLMTTTKDTPGMLHVRSQNYPIGQWSGKRGLVTNAEYVNPEGVNVSESTYTLDPNYGWRRLFAEDASTAKWADTVKTPQITAENAASITPKQWTAAQDAAIARGDMAEAQRLRDLHFKVNTPGNVVTKEGMPTHNYHGTDEEFNIFSMSARGRRDNGDRGLGFYFSENRNVSEDYGPIVKDFYLYAKTPYKGFRNEKYLGRGKSKDEVVQYLTELHKKRLEDDVKVMINQQKSGSHSPMYDNLGITKSMSEQEIRNLVNKAYNHENVIPYEVGNLDEADVFLSPYENVVYKPNQIKSADAVTYDDNGVRIPLGERDNFNINDIRYGLLPFGIGLAGYGLWNNKEQE